MKIVCLSGTSRPDNYTSRALKVVADYLSAQGHEIEFFDPREMHLNFPGQESTEDAKRMQDAVRAADGVVLATPEYHGSFSAMTKLMIENMGFPSALGAKPVALLGVAAGRIGAIKSLEQLRGVCSHTGAIVLPKAVSIAGVQGAFSGDECTDERTKSTLEGLGEGLMKFIGDYVAPKRVLEALVREGADKPWPVEL